MNRHGPKPKPAHLKKLRRSFRFSHMTVSLIDRAVEVGWTKNDTEAVERAVRYCYDGKKRQFKG